MSEQLVHYRAKFWYVPMMQVLHFFLVLVFEHAKDPQTPHKYIDRVHEPLWNWAAKHGQKPEKPIILKPCYKCGSYNLEWDVATLESGALTSFVECCADGCDAFVEVPVKRSRNYQAGIDAWNSIRRDS